MATPAQIEANRRNAELSTGPTSPDGKSASSRNSWKHGMAGGGKAVEEGMAAAFEGRRADFAGAYRPEGEFADWVLDRVVAATFRIELCERSLDAQVSLAAFRAANLWDSDRRLEALELLARLHKDPARVAPRLEATPQGCALMIERWEGLASSSLGFRGEWTDAEASLALDLLGVAPESRTSPTAIGAPDAIDHRLRLCLDEQARLRARQEVLGPVDALEREQTESGALGLLTRSARLIERYERDAWRRLNQGLDTLRRLAEPVAEAVAPPVEAPAPAPAVAAAAPAPPAGRGRARGGPRPRRRTPAPCPRPRGRPSTASTSPSPRRRRRRLPSRAAEPPLTANPAPVRPLPGESPRGASRFVHLRPGSNAGDPPEAGGNAACFIIFLY